MVKLWVLKMFIFQLMWTTNGDTSNTCEFTNNSCNCTPMICRFQNICLSSTLERGWFYWHIFQWLSHQAVTNSFGVTIAPLWPAKRMGCGHHFGFLWSAVSGRSLTMVWQWKESWNSVRGDFTHSMSWKMVDFSIKNWPINQPNCWLNQHRPKS